MDEINNKTLHEIGILKTSISGLEKTITRLENEIENIKDIIRDYPVTEMKVEFLQEKLDTLLQTLQSYTSILTQNHDQLSTLTKLVKDKFDVAPKKDGLDVLTMLNNPTFSTLLKIIMIALALVAMSMGIKIF